MEEEAINVYNHNHEPELLCCGRRWARTQLLLFVSVAERALSHFLWTVAT